MIINCWYLENEEWFGIKNSNPNFMIIISKWHHTLPNLIMNRLQILSLEMEFVQLEMYFSIQRGCRPIFKNNTASSGLIARDYNENIINCWRKLLSVEEVEAWAFSWAVVLVQELHLQILYLKATVKLSLNITWKILKLINLDGLNIIWIEEVNYIIFLHNFGCIFEWILRTCNDIVAYFVTKMIMFDRKEGLFN